MKNKSAILLLLLLCISFPVIAQDNDEVTDKPDALVLYNNEKFREAIKVCKNELAEMPRNKDSYVVMGWSLLAIRDYEEAIVQMGKALAFAPNDPRLLRTMGKALYKHGRGKDSLRYFQKLINVSTDVNSLADIYYYTGEIYIDLKEYNNADISFTTALHFRSNKASWWSRLGYARELNEDYEWALAAYEKAIDLEPGLDEAVRGINSVNKKLGRG